MRHVLAWVAWAVAAATAALAIRHPLYLTIVLLSAGIVYLAVERNAAYGRAWRGLLRVGALIWLVTIPFNALAIHQGRVVLFRLPGGWPLVGGNITLEAVALGFVNGYALWTLLVVMAAFNLAVDPSMLLRYTPGFAAQAGVATSIALTFIPQMLASLGDIRDAQRLRGHRFRRWRDQLPLVMPLLTTALERAIQLAESMESRGFGRAVSGTGGAGMALVFGLVCLLAGLVARALGVPGLWPWALLGGGLAALLWALTRLHRRAAVTRYRRERWSLRDTLVALLSGVVLGGVAATAVLAREAIIYYPFAPGGLLPTFDPRLGLLLMLLSAPGLLSLARDDVAAGRSLGRGQAPAGGRAR